MKFAYLIEPPFNYRNPDGTVAGCDIDLAKSVFSSLGIADVTFVEAEFADLLPGLSDGRWQMTTGLFSTEERRAHAAFSRPIWALPDGLLVQRGNPYGLLGYRSIADRSDCFLAVIRDQFQHRSAVEFGVPETRIVVFETYADAAAAVRDGIVAAYASVERAHSGFVALDPDPALDVVTVPSDEKSPAYGCFGFSPGNSDLRQSVDAVLDGFLGSVDHCKMMARYGFSASEVDILVS